MEEKYLERFIGMEKDVAAIKEDVGEIKHTLNQVVANHEERISCLERVQPAVAGAAKMKSMTAAGGAGIGIGAVLYQLLDALRPLIERLAHLVR